jgi:Domain of unknown function (DUF1707)
VLASDSDRDRVVQALKDGYVQGRLTHEELDQRLAAALRSRTTEEVQALLDDLRPRPAPPAAVPPAPPALQLQQGLAPYVNWWPGLAIGFLLLAVVGETHSFQYLWWVAFPAFFWFRGGRHRRYRGPRA